MKKVILFALIGTSALISCNDKKETTPQPEVLYAPASKVAYRETTVVAASGQDLSISLKEVAESRCPADVVCIQAGNAEVTFAISDGANNAIVKAVFSGDGKNSGVADFTLGTQKYSLKVSEVLPYPKTSEQPKLEDYKVSVSIAKQ